MVGNFGNNVFDVIFQSLSRPVNIAHLIRSLGIIGGGFPGHIIIGHVQEVGLDIVEVDRYPSGKNQINDEHTETD